MLVWEMSAVSPSRLKYCYADYLLSCEVSWPPPFDEGYDGMIVVMVMVMGNTVCIKERAGISYE